jgi:hypothetical protein
VLFVPAVRCYLETSLSLNEPNPSLRHNAKFTTCPHDSDALPPLLTVRTPQYVTNRFLWPSTPRDIAMLGRKVPGALFVSSRSSSLHLYLTVPFRTLLSDLALVPPSVTRSSLINCQLATSWVEMLHECFSSQLSAVTWEVPQRTEPFFKTQRCPTRRGTCAGAW